MGKEGLWKSRRKAWWWNYSVINRLSICQIRTYTKINKLISSLISIMVLLTDNLGTRGLIESFW